MLANELERKVSISQITDCMSSEQTIREGNLRINPWAWKKATSRKFFG